MGYYEQGEGNSVVPITPVRIRDTRPAPLTVGGAAGAVPGQGTITIDPKVAPGLPAVGDYSAVVINVVATGPAAAGWLTVYPSDAVSIPNSANLNFAAGQTLANLVKIAVGADGKVKVTNTFGCACAGSVHLVVDIVGYYV